MNPLCIVHAPTRTFVFHNASCTLDRLRGKHRDT